MKKVFLLLTITATSFAGYAQQGLGVGNTNPQEMLDVTGAIKLGTTTNNNVGTIRWNGTEFQGRTASGWVSLSSVGALYTAGTGLSLSGGNVFSHDTQTAIDVDATNNGTNVVDRVTVNNLGHVTAVIARDLSAATTSAAGVMSSSDKTKLDGIATGATANAGTVTTVSVTTANGVSGTVANPTTTPAISVQLGAITPTSVAATGTITGSNISGANTGDQTAAQVVVTPTGNLAADDVQEALVELQGDINNIAPTIEDVLTNGDVAADGQNLEIDKVRARDADGLQLTDDADKGIFIKDGGNVGIGASDPEFLLDVSGAGLNQGGVTSSDNVLARFEQTTNAGAGIQIKGFRNLANSSSFIDFMNETSDGGGSVYTLGRVEGVNVDAGSQGALAFYTNNGTALTERMRINAAGTVQLNAYTTNGIVRTTSGNGTLSTVGGGVNLASEVTGVLPIANGGTGSATQNFVDLTTAQTVAGVKTWSSNAIFNGNVGIGTSTLPASSRLTLAGFSTVEGGEIQLNGGTSHTSSAYVMDNYEGRFRLIKGTNSGGSVGGTEVLTFKGTNQLGIGNIGGNTWPAESNLIIGANAGVVEGGQIQFNNASGAGTAWFLDVETNNFRFMTGNNITGSSALAGAISNTGDLTMAGNVRSNTGRFYGELGCDNYLKLQADGNMVIYNGSTYMGWASGTNCSDIRLKENVKNIESVLDNLKDFDVIRYKYKEETGLTQDAQIGVVAQQIAKHYPEIVYYNEEIDQYLVFYDKLSALLLKGMQEQQDMIEKLQQENVSVTTNYASLVSDMEKIKGVLGLDFQTSK
jgi:hypothetical protein